MAAGQFKTGSMTYGAAQSRTVAQGAGLLQGAGAFGRKSGVGSGALGLNSVPTRLRAPNAGLGKLARKLNVAGRFSGIARRRAVAASVKVNRTPRSGYPSIKS